jgi:iduronate 2-sulfatase
MHLPAAPRMRSLIANSSRAPEMESDFVIRAQLTRSFGTNFPQCMPDKNVTTGSTKNRPTSPFYFARVLIPVVAVLLGATSLCLATDKPVSPLKNVLLIVSDDLCNQLGTYGHSIVKSPNLDRLATRGVRFDRAYCQYPLCNPSRASMMTGMRPDRTGVVANQTHFRQQLPEHVTLPQLFKNHGYRVARVGKIFHYGVPGQIGTSGFDDPPSWQHVVNPRGSDRNDEHLIYSIQRGNLGRALSWLAAEGSDEQQTDGIGALEAIKLLKEFQHEPFFLAVGFYRPHTPFVAPKKYFDMYPLESIELPEQVENDHADIPKLATYESRHAYSGHDNLSDPQRRQAIQAYYAATTFMDAQLGKLLDAVDELGLADNTIILFTSDHGWHIYEHGLWHKRSLFEESARVPLVIAAPGIKGKGQVSPRVVELIDLYPTLADLCELPIPPVLQGISLKAQLDDPGAATKEGALTQVRRGKDRDGYSVRTERWRYTEWENGKSGVELYDHESDPHEFTNLFDDPQHAKTLSDLRTLLSKLRKKNSATITLGE